MYLRCSAESKPMWNGNKRVLFQNKSSHKPASTKTKACSSRGFVDLLKTTRQRRVPTVAIATRKIHTSQLFFIASQVRGPFPIEFPGPGILAVDASAARCH